MLLDLESRPLMMQERVAHLRASAEPAPPRLRRGVGRAMIALGMWLAAEQRRPTLGRHFA